MRLRLMMAHEPDAGLERPVPSCDHWPVSRRGDRVEHDQTWGWAGTVADFAALKSDEYLDALSAHHFTCCHQRPSGSQITAWRDTHRVLAFALAEVAQANARVGESWLVFEYELPRERGRRPDVVLLSGDKVVVLEFKQQGVPDRAFIDQAEAYARDLADYHEASHNREVTPLLVLTGSARSWGEIAGVRVCGAGDLGTCIVELIGPAGAATDPEQWLTSDYAPLPSLVRAARMIFNHEPLPRIRRAESLGVNDAVDELRRVAEQARSGSGMHLALVTGVPGAGKTLVGLQFVYDSHFVAEDGQEAIFLSGNGPLVNVLQYTLSKESAEGRVFVRDVHGFLKRYGGMSERVPKEHIWVYDEAQRAWDLEHVQEKGRSNFSEPEDFLRIGLKQGDWALMVGLIGAGQEIHVGEEAGLIQWNDAIAASEREWTVHCPLSVAGLFSAAARTETNERLNLDRTLRSHRAEEVHDWVDDLLAGRIDQAKVTSRRLHAAGFDMLVTRDAEAARLYVRNRYEGFDDARYGLLVSSQARGSAPGFRDDFYLKPGPWFSDGPESARSCCALEVAATEFQCQGLELDMPIIGWGDDLTWTGLGWHERPKVRRRLHNPLQITKNCYRVLLTRGRDGFAVVVPQAPEMDGVFDALVAAGCDNLVRTWL
jgi:hypothetical protein